MKKDMNQFANELLTECSIVHFEKLIENYTIEDALKKFEYKNIFAQFNWIFIGE
jgi:hypothetical protein